MVISTSLLQQELSRLLIDQTYANLLPAQLFPVKTQAASMLGAAARKEKNVKGNFVVDDPEQVISAEEMNWAAKKNIQMW